jgi:hypothetical protein
LLKRRLIFERRVTGGNSANEEFGCAAASRAREKEYRRDGYAEIFREEPGMIKANCNAMIASAHNGDGSHDES